MKVLLTITFSILVVVGACKKDSSESSGANEVDPIVKTNYMLT